MVNQANLMNLALNAHQSFKAEQAAREMGDLRKAQERQNRMLQESLNKQAAEDQAQRDIREFIHENRSMLDMSFVEDGEYSKLVKAIICEKNLKGIDSTQLVSVEDKKYHAETIILAVSVKKEFTEEHGDTIFPQIENVTGLVETIFPQIEKIGDLVNAGKPLLSSFVASIEDNIVKLKKSIDDLPEIKEKDFGLEGLDAIQKTFQNSFVIPYNHNLFFLKCLVHVAKSDGDLASTEAAFIESIAGKIQIDVSDFNKVMNENEPLNPEAFSGDEADKEYLLINLIRCSLADEKFEESEGAAVIEVGKLIGLTEEKIRQTVIDYPNNKDKYEQETIVDSNVISQILEEARPKEIKGLHLQGAYPPDINSFIKDKINCSVDDLLFICETKTLGSRSGALAMSKSNLYFSKARIDKEFDIIPISECASIEKNLFGSLLNLRNGESKGFAGFKHFTPVLNKIIKRGVRTI